VEKQLEYNEKRRFEQETLGKQEISIKSGVKNLTFSIILRVSGAIFQSFLSILACTLYVVNTYY
jgi:hypothetical protein